MKKKRGERGRPKGLSKRFKNTLYRGFRRGLCKQIIQSDFVVQSPLGLMALLEDSFIGWKGLKEDGTTWRVNWSKREQPRVFPLFQLSIDFFASPSVYTPGAFLPSISAVFFPSSLFLSSTRFFSPPLPFSTSVCSRFESNFHPPFFAGKSAERNFRWLIIFFHQFGSEELLDDYRYVRSSVRKCCHHRWFFFFFSCLSL